MKIWDKGTALDAQIEAFTVGQDRELDLLLAPFDILGTIAHTQMLNEVGLLGVEEYRQLKPKLVQLYHESRKAGFQLHPEVEDIHSDIELRLSQSLGDIGKKVHSGRSRNDQVLLDLKLYIIDEQRQILALILELFKTLQHQSETYKSLLLPGYTHLQVAMPSSFGLWFGAYAEALIDDVSFLAAAFQVADQNPLGSAAGYGSSFPLDRQRTTELLGFRTLAYNVVYAQMGRGKLERAMAYAIGSLASTLNKLASDVCLYMSQNFGFVALPNELTTGSSIMPHKKNPDVFEILRARTNRLQGLSQSISLTTTNLPSGYHRDLQLTKEMLLPAIQDTKACLHIAHYAMERMTVKADILSDPRYQYLFSVEVVNQKVLAGVPFRDAYRQVAAEIEAGDFTPQTEVNHTHLGSIGNLNTQEIKQKMDEALLSFSRLEAFEKAQSWLLAS